MKRIKEIGGKDMLKDLWKELLSYHREIVVLGIGSMVVKDYVVPLVKMFLGL